MPHGILDIVSKYPEIEHIACRVKESPVKKHGCEYRHIRRRIFESRAHSQYKNRFSAIPVQKMFKVLAKREFIDECKGVYCNQSDCYKWIGTCWVVIL